MKSCVKAGRTIKEDAQNTATSMQQLCTNTNTFLFGNHIQKNVCLQTVRDSGAQCVKSLFRNKKELCSVGIELQARDSTRLTEVSHTNHFANICKARPNMRFIQTINCALSDSFCVSAWSV